MATLQIELKMACARHSELHTLCHEVGGSMTNEEKHKAAFSEGPYGKIFTALCRNIDRAFAIVDSDKISQGRNTGSIRTRSQIFPWQLAIP
jgi:hypothetical protein